MNKFLISMLFAVASLPLAYAKNVVPQFSDYPVKAVYTGKTAKLDLSDPSANMFRTRLRDALTQKPDFAGEYVTTMWGCGGGCRVYSFVNKRTGQLLADGFGGEERTEDVIATRSNSRLLVTQEEHMDQNYAVDQVTTRFYVLEKNRFKLIKTITQPASKTQ
ncbi:MULTISPECIES: hypothetical protein [Acinetobacter]|jgi:hypothetical protein|uniref:hypothetical protein n=1 Tax=Acinetobacter TaxID=469 RepID=UPI0006F43ED0|nr:MULTISPECIES: hypothetical protein [Acinetobacter]KQX02354.1 hypothetical protein ASC84_15510 [Acinetobacter sp. Root1280]